MTRPRLRIAYAAASALTLATFASALTLLATGHRDAPVLPWLLVPLLVGAIGIHASHKALHPDA